MKIFLFILFVSFINIAYSQNLLYNGSIEELKSSCVAPTPNLGIINIFSFKPSPDAYNSCFVDTFPLVASLNHISVPNNNTGYQFARTGDGYLGFALWEDLGNNYPFSYLKLSAEMPSFVLKKKLIAGKKYCIEFWMVNSELSDYATDAVEAAMSSDSIGYVWDSISYYYRISHRGKGFIEDTLSWTKVHDTITANGLEKYMHIGRFSRFDSSNVIPIIPSGYGYAYLYNLINLSYYYLDDVTLYPCDTIAPTAWAGNDTLICKGDSAYIGRHNHADYYYSWWHDSICAKNGATEIQRDEHWGKIWVSPTKSTWYYVQATDFKFHKTLDSVFIKVLPCTCVKKDTALCQGQSYMLGNGDAFYIAFNWSPSAFLDNPLSAIPIASPDKSMWFYVNASDTLGGSIYDSVFINVKHCSPTIADTTICIGTDIIIGNNNPLYKSWIWSPSNYLNNPTSATPTASPPDDITYYVSAIDSLGNIDEDTVNITTKNCDKYPDLLIPKAFTPNGDGINDIFIYGNDEYWQLTTKIYNSWGELIFEGNNNTRWNGTHRNQPAIQGAYIYIINGRSGTEIREWKGSVVLYR